MVPIIPIWPREHNPSYLGPNVMHPRIVPSLAAGISGSCRLIEPCKLSPFITCTTHLLVPGTNVRRRTNSRYMQAINKTRINWKSSLVFPWYYCRIASAIASKDCTTSRWLSLRAPKSPQLPRQGNNLINFTSSSES